MRITDTITIGFILLTASGLLAPAMAKISSDKQNTICQEHLQLLVKAMHAYASEHDGMLPAAVDRSVRPWTWWYDRTRPYVERNRWYYCPTKSPEPYEHGEEEDPLEPEAWDHKKLAYGMNWRLEDSAGKDDVKEPERLILLGDAEFYLMRATKAMWSKDASTRHDGQANFAFLDGHVERGDPQPDKFSGPKAKGILNDKHWRP